MPSFLKNPKSAAATATKYEGESRSATESLNIHPPPWAQPKNYIAFKIAPILARTSGDNANVSRVMASISSPVPASTIKWRWSLAARKSASLSISANAMRKAASRSGDDGAADLGGAGDGAQDHAALVGRRKLRQRRHVRQQAMPLQRRLIDDRRFALVDPAGMADQHSRQAVGAGDVDLAALHGEQDLGGALVAAHDLELGAGIGVERHRIEHRGRAAARGADGIFLPAHVRERFDPGRRQSDAGIDIGGDAADVMEIRGIHLGRAADRAVERQGLRKAAEHGAVLRRHLGHVF